MFKMLFDNLLCEYLLQGLKKKEKFYKTKKFQYPGILI